MNWHRGLSALMMFVLLASMIKSKNISNEEYLVYVVLATMSAIYLSVKDK